jgi:hypothetical protein
MVSRVRGVRSPQMGFDIAMPTIKANNDGEFSGAFIRRHIDNCQFSALKIVLVARLIALKSSKPRQPCEIASAVDTRNLSS